MGRVRLSGRPDAVYGVVKMQHTHAYVYVYFKRGRDAVRCETRTVLTARTTIGIGMPHAISIGKVHEFLNQPEISSTGQGIVQPQES